ncbi:glutamyl aminopeptidase-like isoform X2 [Pectinophora gossypiella]|uniref:glutamyl aminopeptidase-like isoform X2 n=1 Tax=Pectinophora gossypiella TaxID=13191 RepID=UPI00214E7567|nr:glutamyl aminopeptidase-like isoform X2 [Pectinophora gossypiella]
MPAQLYTKEGRMRAIAWLRDNKGTVFLGICTLSLLTSTVVLAFRNTQLVKCDHQATDSNIKSLKGDEASHAKSINYRLPRNVVPKNYKLMLQPDFHNKTFKGTVIITIDVIQTTNQIVLHSENLEIHSIFLSTPANKNIPAIYDFSGDDRNFLYVDSQQMIEKRHPCTLRIQFKGRLDKNIVGFYKSTLKNGRTMVASKFQPTYTRQAFPCFDEPEYKATFDISLLKPPGYLALSNMNEISKNLDTETNMEVVTFATSVPMSAYLVCFVVCDFDHKKTEVNANGIGKDFTLRAFAQKDQMHKINFALDIGLRATEYYIKYYQVPFPLPKLDMIAIPDYQSGATEHWGLVTYRETSFLVDEATASTRNKINVANTIAHELAHMWFGNLVTLKWWDDLWLNEGFATYMQNKALNAIEPSWTMLDQFLTRTLHPVLVFDAKLSSHPIVQTVETPDQITAIFDSISYNKGASILRMLEGFIGEENFRQGISDYLKKYKFGNTVTQDLLDLLEPYFKKNNPDLKLSYIVDTWTTQMGYPVLTVSKSDEPNKFIITQQRFLLDPQAKYSNDYRWFVPITYKTNKGSSENILWFPDNVDSVTLTLKEDETWLKINNNQVGYYRVNYPYEMWDELIKELQSGSKKLTISDRAHLLNEIFALADASRVPYRMALNLTTYLTTERDYVPWSAAVSVLHTLKSRLLDTTAFGDLLKYVQKLVKPLYEKQTWERTNIGVTDRLLRVTVMSLAASFQLPEAEAKIRELFLQWLENKGTPKATEFEPDLREIIYAYGMKTANMAEWDKLWQIYLKEEDAQEQSKLRIALAAPRDTTLLRKYLTLAWDEKYIRGQDYLTVIQQISANPSGTAIVWDEVRSRWPEFVARFTLNSRYLGNMVPGVTSMFSTEIKLKEMNAFFAEHPDAGAGEAARRRALETVRDNIRWNEHYLAPVTDWLQAQSQ